MRVSAQQRMPPGGKGHAMKLARRQFLHLAAGAVALPAVSQIARAQTYPSKPVRIIVVAAAGGGADITARLMGQWLSERLGQPFIIENRAGAGGNVATEAAVRAAHFFSLQYRIRSMRRFLTS
jgi:tripartite-type tricarboxylate transporter receptor subunit TctC